MFRSQLRTPRFAILLFVLAIAFTVAESLLPQTSKEWEWVDKRYDVVLNDLLPMKGNPGYYVTYRPTRGMHMASGEEPEYFFRLGIDVDHGINDHVSAHVRTADGISIYNQMMNIHDKTAGVAAKDIESRMRMKSFDYTEKTCPVVGKEFRDFQELRYGPPYTDVDHLAVLVDSPMYEFHIAAEYGEADVTMYDAKHPLVVWAMKTRRELEACKPEQSK